MPGMDTVSPSRIRNMFLRESGNSHSTSAQLGRFKNDGNAPQVVQCVFYQIADRSFERQRAHGDLGVHRTFVACRAAAIRGIVDQRRAQQGVGQVLQMPSNLVAAAAQRLHLQQRQPGARVQGLACDRQAQPRQSQPPGAGGQVNLA